MRLVNPICGTAIAAQNIKVKYQFRSGSILGHTDWQRVVGFDIEVLVSLHTPLVTEARNVVHHANIQSVDIRHVPMRRHPQR
jgi:hypothetical protein